MRDALSRWAALLAVFTTIAAVMACGVRSDGVQINGLMRSDESTEAVIIDRPTVIGIVAARCPHAHEYLQVRAPELLRLVDREGDQFLLVDVSSDDIRARATDPDVFEVSQTGAKLLFDRSDVVAHAFPLYFQGGLPTTLFVSARGNPVTRILGLGTDADFERGLDLAAQGH